MIPFDIFEDVTVEIHVFDINKPDRMIWRCTKEQSQDIDSIIGMVKAQGYSAFEIREITTINKLYDLGEEVSE